MHTYTIYIYIYITSTKRRINQHREHRRRVATYNERERERERFSNPSPVNATKEHHPRVNHETKNPGGGQESREKSTYKKTDKEIERPELLGRKIERERRYLEKK